MRFFDHQQFEVKGCVLLDEKPPEIPNSGFGSGRARRPQVIGFDPAKKRIVFGIIREDSKSLDSEESLEEYNVFLDHNASLGERASLIIVLLPAPLVPEFNSLITHYIHREYWYRIITLAYNPSGPAEQSERPEKSGP